jgi:hypothetical protein
MSAHRRLLSPLAAVAAAATVNTASKHTCAAGIVHALGNDVEPSVAFAVDITVNGSQCSIHSYCTVPGLLLLLLLLALYTAALQQAACLAGSGTILCAGAACSKHHCASSSPLLLVPSHCSSRQGQSIQASAPKLLTHTCLQQREQPLI